ncbi:Uncharacterized protein SCG7086_AS_00130 [Chlamydiales bacterium SCGC AG-110-P3]|nr:Uncharacterized protein SCG7086_AS_00130 [Chlamydiales bacterium SCGC AG-110-P3]
MEGSNLVTLALLTLLLMLTLGSGFFSGSEIALFSLPSHKVRGYVNHPNARRRRIAHLLAHPRDLLVTVFILNTIVNILLQNVTSSLFGHTASILIKVGVPLMIVLFLGEIIPKLFAIRYNTRVSYAVAPSIEFFQRVAGPLRTFFTKLTTPISRAMFFFLREDPTISRDELQHVLQESQSQGILRPEEAELIHGYLDLREAQIKEIMRPREDIIYYDINTPLDRLQHQFVDLEVTRIPVTNGEINNLLGVLSARDYFIHRETMSQSNDCKELLQQPFFIPETASAPSILQELDRKDHVMALVVDEYGSITGLITREDLIEEVIGDIKDRRDTRTRYTRASDNVIIASGKLELDEFEELFGAKLHSPSNMVTVGGWLTEQLGDIPKSGQYYQTDDFLFHILAADANRLRRLYIRRLEHGSKREDSLKDRGPQI